MLSMSQVDDLNNSYKVLEPSFYHYPTKKGPEKVDAKAVEDFIHRNSKIPFAHPNSGEIQEYKNTWSPFGEVEIRQKAQIETPKTSKFSIHSPSENQRQIIEEKFREVYESPLGSRKNTSMCDKKSETNFSTIQPPKIIEPINELQNETHIENNNEIQSEIHNELKSEVAPFTQEIYFTKQPEKVERKISDLDIYNTERQNLVKIKEDLKSDIEQKKRCINHHKTKSNLDMSSSRIFTCMGRPVSPKYEAVISPQKSKTRVQSRMRSEISTPISTQAQSEVGKSGSILNTNFGVEHSKNRENEKEKQRVEVRKNLLIPTIMKEEERINNKKDKLYFFQITNCDILTLLK